VCECTAFKQYHYPCSSAVFRKQHTLTIEKQRELGQHFGPLHKHPTYAVPRRGDLDDVVGAS
jgi:sulfonate dioxygenase